MRGRRLALAVLAVGAIGSQAGHLLAFQLRFGSAAQHQQSSGPHAYFPLLAKTGLGVLGAVFVAALFVIGLARVLAGRSGPRRAPAHGYLELLAALFAIQLFSFISQEVGEALVAGVPVDSASHLMLWGSLGQLPVAIVAAMALRWLLARFESAVDDLRAVLAATPARHAIAPVAIAVWPAADSATLLSHVAGASLGKRGPPPFSRVSS